MCLSKKIYEPLDKNDPIDRELIRAINDGELKASIVKIKTGARR